jgi:hypothetical protein
MTIKTAATVDDLYRTEGKAELVNGELARRSFGTSTCSGETSCVCTARTRQTTAIVYRKGDVAEAEPAVRGWTMPVDDLFEST